MTVESSASPLRVGVLGAGRVAQLFHLPILSSLRDVEIVAVAEQDAELRARCRTWVPKAGLFKNHLDMARSGQAEAVVICLPPALHAEAAVASFEHGLHVYLEKPLATTFEEGNRILNVWRKAGTVGRIGFNFRFHPLVVELRDALRQGLIGELVAARSSFCSAAREGRGWKDARSLGGGALLDLGSHQFDLVRYLFGAEVSEVCAMVDSRVSEDDTATVELRLGSGQPVSIFTTIAGVEQHRIEVIGTEGGVVFDRYRYSRLRFSPPKRRYSRGARLHAAWQACAGLPSALRDALFPPRETSFYRALHSFVQAARGESSEGPGLDCGLDSLAVVLAAEEAARTGRNLPLAPALEECA